MFFVQFQKGLEVIDKDKRSLTRWKRHETIGAGAARVSKHQMKPEGLRHLLLVVI